MTNISGNRYERYGYYSSAPISNEKASGRCFSSLKLYKVIEQLMTRVGNSKEPTNMKHLPIILIQTDKPMMMSEHGKLTESVAYADKRAYIIAALAIYTIRDVIARIKNGLQNEFGNDIHSISPVFESSDGREVDYIVDDIIIPPRKMYGKKHSYGFKGKDILKCDKLDKHLDRPSFEKKEMLTIIDMMNESISIQKDWNGFKTSESNFLQIVTEFIFDSDINESFRDPIVVKKEPIADEDGSNDIESQVDVDSQSMDIDYTSFSPPCRFCHCPVPGHGRKDMFTNECKVKGCGTRFKWKKKHWNDRHENDKNFPSLYSLCMKVIKPSNLVPVEIDEIDIQPNDVLIESYRSNNPITFRCIICGK